MAIEFKDVEHLARLARISISDSEKELLKHDLEEILAYVSQVKDITTNIGVPTVGECHEGTSCFLIHDVHKKAKSLRNVMREDREPHEASMFTEALLGAAPAREGNRLLVKKIL